MMRTCDIALGGRSAATYDDTCSGNVDLNCYVYMHVLVYTISRNCHQRVKMRPTDRDKLRDIFTLNIHVCTYYAETS